MATTYTHKSGYIIKVEVFSWHTELTFIDPKTNEQWEHFSNVIEVNQRGNWLYWTAVNMSNGDRQQCKAELMQDSRPMLDVRNPDLAELRAMVKANNL